jgi:membrane protein implicated in regulation of membrane protease activity
MDAIAEWLTPSVTWFLIGVVLLIIELSLPSLVLLFFGIGAWVTSLVCYLGFTNNSTGAQLLVFSIVSVLSLVLLRNKLKHVFFGEESNADKNVREDFVGEHATVISAIEPNNVGRVEVHGSQWKAIADEPIAVGQATKVIAKENLTLKVKSI